jgi:hypothetical protein
LEGYSARVDIEETLALDVGTLVNARKAALKAQISELPGIKRRRDKHWRARDFESALADLPADCRFEPLLRQYLAQKLTWVAEIVADV